MKQLPLNVWLLTVAQALIMSVSSMMVFLGGILGAKLAPSEQLATLPVAAVVVGTALSAVPITLLMKKIGRKNAFFVILIFSILNAFSAAYSLLLADFYLFCFTSLLFGATVACVMQFRFAAMESVDIDLNAKAASTVLLGGIAAAFIGPEAAVFGKDLFSTEFLGSFLLLAGLFLFGLIVLLGFKNSIQLEQSVSSDQRSLKQISRQPSFWIAISSATVAYAIMSFIMTATPVSMHVMDGHSLDDTKWVIQSHILAMFLPSLVTAWIIKKLGIVRMMYSGLLAYIICIIIAFIGHDFFNYWLSLILLGVGWNFLFIAGTTILPQSYRESERFKVQAVNEFVIFGSQAIASLSAGWFVFTMGWETLIAVTIPFILLQIILTAKWNLKSA